MDELRRLESTFSDVDAAETPEGFVRSLDIQNASAFKQAYAQRTFELLELQPGLRVLDAGCGVGLDAARLAELVGPGGEVVGLDYSATMVDEARRRHRDAGSSLTFLQGDLHALPFDDCSFARCRATGTFQHLAEPRRALDELVRVLAPGGLVLIADGDHETQVIDTPYPELTRRFLAWRSDTLAQGGVAHRLYGWYRELGLAEVAVEATTRISTDYAAINSVMHYDGGMRVAQREGIVTPEEADRWIAYVEEAGRTGRFFCALTYLMTLGRKPQ